MAETTVTVEGLNTYVGLKLSQKFQKDNTLFKPHNNTEKEFLSSQRDTCHSRRLHNWPDVTQHMSSNTETYTKESLITELRFFTAHLACLEQSHK